MEVRSFPLCLARARIAGSSHCSQQGLGSAPFSLGELRESLERLRARLPERRSLRRRAHAQHPRLRALFRRHGVLAWRIDQLCQYRARVRSRCENGKRILPDPLRHAARAHDKPLHKTAGKRGDPESRQVLPFRCGYGGRHHQASRVGGTWRSVWEGLRTFHPRTRGGGDRSERRGAGVLAPNGRSPIEDAS